MAETTAAIDSRTGEAEAIALPRGENNSQPKAEPIRGENMECFTAVAAKRYQIKPAQFYEWRKRLNFSPKKTEGGGYELSAEWVTKLDRLRKFLDDGGNIDSFEMQDKPGELSAVQQIDALDIPPEQAEAELIEEQCNDLGVWREAQELWATAQVAALQLAQEMTEDDLDPDLQEMVGKERDRLLKKHNSNQLQARVQKMKQRILKRHQPVSSPQ